MNIGIVILATNIYFALGIRFIKKFMHHYKGDAKITFYFFSDTEPFEYIYDGIDVEYFTLISNTWEEGTNSKFNSILSINDRLKSDYIFYFDADTNINRDFDHSWFLGDIVAGQHFADQSWMKEVKGYDRHEGYNAYVPHDTPYSQMYYLGAFFGGRSDQCISFCNTLSAFQKEDKVRGFEPDVNDESYINAYFHYNPPSKVVLISDFKFDISDKGGIDNFRCVNTDISSIKHKLKLLKDKLIDIRNGEVIKLSSN